MLHIHKSIAPFKSLFLLVLCCSVFHPIQFPEPFFLLPIKDHYLRSSSMSPLSASNHPLLPFFHCISQPFLSPQTNPLTKKNNVQPGSLAGTLSHSLTNEAKDSILTSGSTSVRPLSPCYFAPCSFSCQNQMYDEGG